MWTLLYILLVCVPVAYAHKRYEERNVRIIAERKFQPMNVKVWLR